MEEKNLEPGAAAAKADKLVAKTAQEMKELLQYLAAQLFPFPYFLGSTEVRAIEAEPGGVKRADRGCVVVCADGELYEFTMKMAGPGTGIDFGMDRTDEVKPVELPPEDYIAYAYHGIKELSKLLEEMKARGQKYSW